MVTNNVGHCSLWEVGYKTLVLTRQVEWSSKSSDGQDTLIEMNVALQAEILV